MRLCTLFDTPEVSAEVTATDDDILSETLRLSDLQSWQLVVFDRHAHMLMLRTPDNTPPLYQQRLTKSLADCIGASASEDADIIRCQLTYSDMYVPQGCLLICRRTRDDVRSVFEIATDKPFTPDRLRLFTRKIMVPGLREHMVEYDANNIVYDSKWIGGNVCSHKHTNTDYFIVGAAHGSETSHLYENWVTFDNPSLPDIVTFKS